MQLLPPLPFFLLALCSWLAQVYGYGGSGGLSGSGGSGGSGSSGGEALTEVGPSKLEGGARIEAIGTDEPAATDAAIASEPAARFCNGFPTAMYMQGFVSVFALDRNEQPCAVFLFPTWVLSSHLKFVLGLVGAALVGVLTEAAAAWRRAVESRSTPSWLVHLLLHSLVIALGYACMLLVMVYNFELAAAVIVGLGAGRVLFTRPGAQKVLGGDPNPFIEMSSRGATPCCHTD